VTQKSFGAINKSPKLLLKSLAAQFEIAKDSLELKFNMLIRLVLKTIC